MLAPEGCKKHLLETVSYISGMLVERPDFTTVLKSGSKEEAFDELCGILEEFYKQKYDEYVKDSI